MVKHARRSNYGGIPHLRKKDPIVQNKRVEVLVWNSVVRGWSVLSLLGRALPRCAQPISSNFRLKSRQFLAFLLLLFPRVFLG